MKWIKEESKKFLEKLEYEVKNSNEDANNIDIQFEDGTIVENKTYGRFLLGYISNPKCKNFRKNTRIGEKNKATNGQEMTIIKYNSYADIDVQFEDGTIVEHRTYNCFFKGLIRNPKCKIKKIRKEE